jgi:hypothetical protein
MRKELIRIGVESTKAKFRSDILSHPDRYFFILQMGERAALCIRTCNSRGEDIQTQIIDALKLDHDGNLISAFEDDLIDAISKSQRQKIKTWGGEEYPLSPDINCKISALPDMIDWIILYLLHDDRNILFNTSWEI